MTDIEICVALAAGRITPDQAVNALVEIGADRQDAQFIIDLQTGKTPGDLIGLEPDWANTPIGND